MRPRTPQQKLDRNAKNKERRAAGTLVEWSYSRRTLSERGLKGRMLSAARSRAKKKGLDFDITVDDFEIPSVCPVLGIPFEHRSGKSGACDSSPTLDRIKSNRGYIKGNIEVISWRANRIKCDATPKELKKLARYYGKKSRNKATAKDQTRANQGCRREMV